MIMSQKYCQTIYQAVISNYKNLFADGCIYHGREGCLRLAKEYGAGLADFDTEAEIKNDLQASYGILCVRAYMLKPPVDAKKWISEARKGLDRARRGRA
jgi:hypothetical protein